MSAVEKGAIRQAAGALKRSIVSIAAVALCAAAAVAAPLEKKGAPVAAQGPLLVVVSIGTQRMAVYDRGGRVMESPISSGREGYETPQGVFAIIERNREHFSNLYDDAPMPNMQRITWSGVAMHAGRLPGYPASHGCIRLPNEVSEKLFDLTRLGTRVVVADYEAVPVAIDHPRLFTTRVEEQSVRVAVAANLPAASMVMPMMLGAAAVGEAPPARLPPVVDHFASRPPGVSRAAWAADLTSRAQAADAAAKTSKAKAAALAREASRSMGQVLAAERLRSTLATRVDDLERRIAKLARPAAVIRAEREREALLQRLSSLLAEIDRLRVVEDARRAESEVAATEAKASDEARVAAASLAREIHRSMKPVSVFVSRKAGRLYVRQGFQPLFDVAVAITGGDAPIGTHVFTALDHKPNSDAMDWSVVTSVGAEPEVTDASKRGRRNVRKAPLLPPPRLTAKAALDRVEFPEDVRARVARMLTPGSSLIISDEMVSAETGKGTDFVVLTR